MSSTNEQSADPDTTIAVKPGSVGKPEAKDTLAWSHWYVMPGAWRGDREWPQAGTRAHSWGGSYQGSLWRDGLVLKLDCGSVCATVHLLKSEKSFHLKWVHCMARKLYLNETAGAMAGDRWPELIKDSEPSQHARSPPGVTACGSASSGMGLSLWHLGQKRCGLFWKSHCMYWSSGDGEVTLSPRIWC